MITINKDSNRSSDSSILRGLMTEMGIDPDIAVNLERHILAFFDFNEEYIY